MQPFLINFLDHVAIRVKDVEASAQWYQKVLGLKRYDVPEWKNIPVFMLAGKTGVAIFPARVNEPELHRSSKDIRIDHFAFNVSNEDFKKAKHHYESIGQEFEFQDHIHFHSIYTKDPDGHTVELTTIAVDEEGFYI
ncbi:MAG: VOC family protein [Chitinophagaceae bacterium]